jgi:hypothetical protein
MTLPAPRSTVAALRWYKVCPPVVKICTGGPASFSNESDSVSDKHSDDAVKQVEKAITRDKMIFLFFITASFVYSLYFIEYIYHQINVFNALE